MSDQPRAEPGIPAIAPYPMPAAADLPAAAVDWTPDPARAVLLLHDMQEFFLRPFPPGQAPVTDLVRNATALRERCAALGVPVAFTAQPGGMTPEQRGLLRDFWGDGMSLDPASRRIVDPLAPRPGDWLFTKWRYSAFQRSDLRDRLRDAGRDQLLICGVYAHVGVLMTAVDAFSQDVQPFLAADAIADFTAGDHAMALSYAARRCAAVATTGQLLARLDAPVGAGNPAGGAA